MKKIMFNDKYGLTKAVLEGRKTQTRRLVGSGQIYNSSTNSMYRGELSDAYKDMLIRKFSRYSLNEEVAVAQSYKDAGCDFYFHRGLAGWNNKMFVRAEDMPHRIKITNVRIERLQDISDEDCLKEGVKMIGNYKYGVYGIWDKSYKEDNAYVMFDTARQAFSTLIDKTCGKGTWNNNPWVFVYDFELIQ